MVNETNYLLQRINDAESPVSLDRVRSYRKNKAAFMVGRLWVKGLKIYD
ncbi:hypothetical protein [Moorena sp. SIO3H5]|nr:hypothetical protein [Moorena sp. SIO3H5]